MLPFIVDCNKESTIIFLLDRSRHVGGDNIKMQEEFIISVAESLSYSNIGVVSYGAEAQFVTRPGYSSNFSDFADTIRSSNYSMRFEKNLGKALRKAMEETELFNASKAAVIVVMIAGISEDEHEVTSLELRKMSVTILALILGPSYSTPQINLLVSKPVDDHILRTDFTDLKSFIDVSRDAICKGLYLTLIAPTMKTSLDLCDATVFLDRSKSYIEKKNQENHF